MSTAPVVTTHDPRALNSLKDGLFTHRDFIRPGEIGEYEEFRSSLLADLTPATALERNYADEIISAQWRLRRCRLIETMLAARCDDELRLSPEDERRQNSVDRARAQANVALRKASTELRKVQTERECRVAFAFGEGFGIGEIREVVRAITQWREEVEANREAAIRSLFNSPLPPPRDPNLFCNSVESEANPESDATAASDNLFCKNTPVRVEKIGRNEPCPCGSGQKYKRCCLNHPKN